jgi:hypothetical protein
MPKLLALAKADENARAALLVTSSLLPEKPEPLCFALSMTKAAQPKEKLTFDVRILEE